jgi:hypothetical protein
MENLCLEFVPEIGIFQAVNGSLKTILRMEKCHAAPFRAEMGMIIRTVINFTYHIVARN